MRREGQDITTEMVYLQRRIAICVRCMRECHAIVLSSVIWALSMSCTCVRASVRSRVDVCVCAHTNIHTYICGRLQYSTLYLPSEFLKH